MTGHAVNGPLTTVAAVAAALALCLTTTLKLEAARGGAGRAARATVAAGMVRIAAGSYRPLYSAPQSLRDRAAAARASTISARQRRVAAFDVDAFAVTNGEYLAFVREHPEWRRSRARKLFVDDAYLRHWAGDLDPGTASLNAPVVSVSWFAARAYLKAQGKQLPSVDQWEYVAAASESERDASRSPAMLERLRVWYGRPTPDVLPPVTSGVRNVYGVTGLHGLIWEWTLDFNSSLVTGESRADASLDRTLYCGAGAAAASDFEDYAAFMRYAFRASLEARYSVPNLGFRGVRAIEKDHP